MSDDATSLIRISPWKPCTVPLDLKHLGKFAEETSELGAAISRCIIQGIDELEPVTGKSNREWIEDEIADVLAQIDVNGEYFGLSRARIMKRMEKKIEGMRIWYGMN